MMLQAPGVLSQGTFIHNIYQNFIDVVDICLKCEMQKREIDYSDPRVLGQKLNKMVPPGARDHLVGTFFWDNEELLSVERHDYNGGHTWSYIIKSSPIKGDGPPQQESGSPLINYST